MAAITSVTFLALAQSPDRKFSSRSSSVFTSQSPKLLGTVSYDLFTYRASAPRFLVHCMSTAADVPTVSQTKSKFLRTYKKPIPSIYNTVLQELIVQQHLIRYKTSYRYDPVFALGFVTVYDQLMGGYPEDEERDAIFKSYIEALNEDPAQYRIDAKKLEEWSQTQSTSTLVEFQSRGGEVENILKEISQRAGSKGSFSYSRFFAVGLFRILELANATESSILDMLCAALNINKKSVDRDLDVYRNLLSKLVQAKELLKEYIDRERKKNEERTASQKPNEAVTKILGNNQLTAISLHTCR